MLCVCVCVCVCVRVCVVVSARYFLLCAFGLCLCVVLCVLFFGACLILQCVCVRACDMCSRGFCFFPVCSHSRSLLVCVLCVSMRVRAFFVCLFSCVFARRMYVCCVCVGEGVLVCV